jgi:hypothetical protein
MRLGESSSSCKISVAAIEYRVQNGDTDFVLSIKNYLVLEIWMQMCQGTTCK